jgi:hypothetical protein
MLPKNSHSTISILIFAGEKSMIDKKIGEEVERVRKGKRKDSCLRQRDRICWIGLIITS